MVDRICRRKLHAEPLERQEPRALFIAWPCAIAAAAVRVLARRRAWPVAIGYAVAVALLVLAAIAFAATH